MIEPVAYWTPLITGLSTYLPLLAGILVILEKLGFSAALQRAPLMLKLLIKFLIYFLSLVIPNVVIIWYFFYLAGSSPQRLWEGNFFWAVVAYPTVGVSLYAYAWAKWFYPFLQRILGDSEPQQGDSEPQQNTKPRQSAARAAHTSKEPSKSGGKK